MKTLGAVKRRLTVAAALACASVCLLARDAAAVGGRHDPVPILMYHVIGSPPAGAAFPELFVRPADFAAQMRWLARRGYHAVTLADVHDHWYWGSRLPPRPIVVTFDDGYLSHYWHALPVLRRLQWPGVLNLKVRALSSVNVMPAWRVRALIAAGWELAAHTITHPDLTSVADAQLWREVHGSRAQLIRTFRVRVDFFCYPSGRYDARVVDAVSRAGYLGATTTNYGLARPADPFTLSRVRVDRSDGVTGLARKLADLTP